MSFLVSQGAGGNHTLALADGGTLPVSVATSAPGSGTVTSVSATPPLSVAGDPTVSPDLQLTGQVDVPHGGTGRASLTTHGLLVGAAAGAVNVTGTGTAGQVMTSNGPAADPTFQSPAGSQHAWLYDALVPANITTPTLGQTQAVAGAGQPINIRTQAAATGSNANGGGFNVVLGAKDGTGVPTPIQIGAALTPTGSDPASFTNFFGGLSLQVNPTSGVTILTMGRGNNAIGGGVAGNEFSTFGLFNVATELASGGSPTAPIRLQPAGTFGGQSYFSFEQDSDGSPFVRLATSPGNPVASAGVFRFEYASTGALLVQRNSGDTGDLGIARRVLGELYFGSAEESNRYLARDGVQFVISTPGGRGWTFFGPIGQVLQVDTDNNKTIRHGLENDLRDGSKSPIFALDTTTTTADQVVAPITLVDDAVTVLSVVLSAFPAAPNTDYAGFTLAATFRKDAGVIAAVSTPTVLVNTGNSVAAVGIDPKFVIVGGNVEVQVTPWTTDPTHWSAICSLATNVGTF